MTPEDALTPIAEIAIALAGFTSVVTVFRRFRDDSWTIEERVRIRNLIALSFSILLCALLPFALSGLSDSPFIVWGVPSGCVPVLVDFRRSPRADELNSIFDQPIRSVPPCDA